MAKSRDGERFARLTQSLLESEAVATLPPTAFKLLTVLALGVRPPGLDPRKDKGNNGAQAVTYSYARRFGFTSKDTLQRGLQTLIERGLVIKTRDGWKSKNHFALYAVAWLPITHRDGQPLDTPEKSLDAWRTWKAESSPTTGHDRKAAAVNLRPDYRDQSGPTTGQDGALSGPIVSARCQLSSPTTGHTLRTLGSVSNTAAHANGAYGVDSLPIPAPLSQSRKKSQKSALPKVRMQ